MPKPGVAYPIDSDWRKRVLVRMGEKGIKNKNQLAILAKCSRSAITEIFDPECQRSMLVPSIHKVLGWDPPPGSPLMSADEEEMLKVMRALPPEDRARMMERGQTLLELLKARRRTDA